MCFGVVKEASRVLLKKKKNTTRGWLHCTADVQERGAAAAIWCATATASLPQVLGSWQQGRWVKENDIYRIILLRWSGVR